MDVEIEAGLWYSTERGRGAIVCTRTDRRFDPLLSFSAADGCVRTSLVLLDGDRLLDLSGHPAAVADVVAARAARLNHPAARWQTALAETVANDSASWHSATFARGTTSGSDLLRVIGALRFPALAAAYDAGAPTEGEIPRWARASLSGRSAREMAATAFGTKATRPVVRAVGRWLVADAAPSAEPPAHPLGWPALAVTIAGNEILEPDHIAALLAVHPESTAAAPTVDDAALLRASAHFLGAERYRRLATEAITTGQVPCMLRVLRLLRSVRHVITRPTPTALDALEHACLSVAALDPRPPAPPPPPPRPVRVLDAPPAPRVDAAWTTPRGAPVRPSAHRAHDRLSYGASVADLDGRSVGEVTLCLPRTNTELRQWGRLLHNCLGDFTASTATGYSVVVGVRRDDQLIGALELRPDTQTLVQFLGDRNRRLPLPITTAVHAALRQRLLVR